MRGRLRGWLALSGAERRLLVGLLLALPIVHAALAVSGYVRTRRWLERISRHANPRVAAAADLIAAERLAELTHIAGHRGAVTATCLRQSLLVYTLLRRRGLQPELKIGVRKQDRAFDAHAWVELAGRPLLTMPTEFSTLTAQPSQTTDVAGRTHSA